MVCSGAVLVGAGRQTGRKGLGSSRGHEQFLSSEVCSLFIISCFSFSFLLVFLPRKLLFVFGTRSVLADAATCEC